MDTGNAHSILLLYAVATLSGMRQGMLYQPPCPGLTSFRS